MKNKSIAIGQVKAKSTAYCTLCGCVNRRTITANVYESTPEATERAKLEIKEKAAKVYTCRICKSIEKQV